MGKASFFVAIAAAGLYASSLLVICFTALFPHLTPDDAPIFALPVVFGPPVSLALGVVALTLGSGCVLLRRRGRAYAVASILVGASVVAITAILTLQPWEVLDPLLLRGHQLPPSDPGPSSRGEDDLARGFVARFPR